MKIRVCPVCYALNCQPYCRNATAATDKSRDIRMSDNGTDRRIIV